MQSLTHKWWSFVKKTNERILIQYFNCFYNKSISCPNYFAELLELWAQSERDLQRLQHSALLRFLLPAQGLGKAPPRMRSDSAGAAAGRDPRRRQHLSHPQQRSRQPRGHAHGRHPSLGHARHALRHRDHAPLESVQNISDASAYRGLTHLPHSLQNANASTLTKRED